MFSSIDNLAGQAGNLLLEPGQKILPTSIVWRKLDQAIHNGFSLAQRGECGVAIVGLNVNQSQLPVAKGEIALPARVAGIGFAKRF